MVWSCGSQQEGLWDLRSTSLSLLGPGAVSWSSLLGAHVNDVHVAIVLHTEAVLASVVDKARGHALLTHAVFLVEKEDLVMHWARVKKLILSNKTADKRRVRSTGAETTSSLQRVRCTAGSQKTRKSSMAELGELERTLFCSRK